uniref:Uncharacterized protein n=1 Tax=Aegilops tauschii subsp. strangulata TaxID=200361 RepID=A0A453S574_AEGTS
MPCKFVASMRSRYIGGNCSVTYLLSIMKTHSSSMFLFFCMHLFGNFLQIGTIFLQIGTIFLWTGTYKRRSWFLGALYLSFQKIIIRCRVIRVRMRSC